MMKNKPHIWIRNGIWFCSDALSLGPALCSCSVNGPSSAYLEWLDKDKMRGDVSAGGNRVTGCYTPSGSKDGGDQGKKELSIFIKSLWCLLLIFVPAIVTVLWWSGYSL